MGYRIQVKLTFPASMRDKVLALSGEQPNEEEPDNTDLIPLLTFVYNEVNYGELSFLGSLEEAGIPYDSWHESGIDYEGTTRHSRFTDEGEVEINYVGDQSGYTIALMDLEKVIDDYDKLKELINTKLADVYVIPWDSQEANSKTYLMRQIVAPD